MILAWQIAGPLLVARAGDAELAVQIVGGHPRYTIRQPAPDGRGALVASGTAPTIAAAMAAAERAHRAPHSCGGGGHERLRPWRAVG